MTTRIVLSAAVLVTVLGCQPADKPKPSESSSIPAATIEAAGRLVSLSVPNMT